MFKERGIEIKSPEQIDKMRVAGLVVGETLELLRAAVRPGVSTLELDTLAEANIRDHGGVPSFKGYSHPPFPATICASVNDEVVHGIPGQRTLVEGDVISIDVGVILDGWVADAARTFAVGPVTPVAGKLLETTKASLFDAVEQCRAGNRLGDVSHAVQARVEGDGLSVVRSLVGHGIGRSMHEDPQIPNYGEPGRGPLLEEGMVLAVEPMVNAGRHGVVSVEVDDRTWTSDAFTLPTWVKKGNAGKTVRVTVR